MSPRDSVLAAVVAVIWGLNFVVIDWGMHGVPPLLFAAIRFTVVVLPAVFLVPRPQVGWRPVVLVGVFMSMTTKLSPQMTATTAASRESRGDMHPSLGRMSMKDQRTICRISM